MRPLPGQPADKATDSLQVRLSELRKAFRSAGEADRLATRPPGYLLRVEPGELDAPRFEQLAAEGAAALAAGDAARPEPEAGELIRGHRGRLIRTVRRVATARSDCPQDR